jgi:hypothetical protein
MGRNTKLGYSLLGLFGIPLSLPWLRGKQSFYQTKDTLWFSLEMVRAL